MKYVDSTSHDWEPDQKLQSQIKIPKMKNTTCRGYNENTPNHKKLMPQFANMATCHLVNNMIFHGMFPSCLKVACISPSCKPNKDLKMFSTYRPISNLNTVQDIMEGVLKDQLNEHIDLNKIITDGNHDCRKITQLYVLKVLWILK